MGEDPTSFGKWLETVQYERDSFLKTPQGRYNGSALQRLPIAKAYLDGDLWIVLRYKQVPTEIDKLGTLLVLINHDYEIFDTAAGWLPKLIGKPRFMDMKFSHGGKKNDMFVSDVQPVKFVEIQLPTWVGLSFISDEIECLPSRNRFGVFLSIDGTFNRLPIPSEREISSVCRGHPICFNEDTVRVIKGSSDVMNCVTENGGCVFGEPFSTELALSVQRCVVILTEQSFHVLTDIGVKKGFQLDDVMIGPL
jgi:hypothetical protein